MVIACVMSDVGKLSVKIDELSEEDIMNMVILIVGIIQTFSTAQDALIAELTSGTFAINALGVQIPRSAHY